MKKGLLQSALIISLLGAATSASQAEVRIQGAIDFRESIMTTFKWYMGPMGSMVKGRMPFDAELFKSRAEGLVKATRLDLAEGYPKGSVGDSEAKPEIWENWDEFEAKIQSLRDEAAKLQEVAATGDEAAIKAQFGETGKVCGSCHKQFRSKK
ncbi:c-type cytochrome [Sedimenticola thiotaurini]|uniref:c-type cytochrome n=1 Tax=Sedimenticola thiotaurini TaxID=1543721 RepID=UPI00069B7963|nr:cytochrome c [Sedimenticola thiotaurini]